MAKRCYLCGRKDAFEHLGREICSICFVRLMERRVQKGLGRAFSKGEKVLVVGDLAGYLVKEILHDLPLKLTFKKKLPSSLTGFDKIVIEETMDEVVSDFLASLFSQNFEVVKDKSVIKILKVMTDEETVKFAQIKKIKFKVSGKNKKLKDFLHQLSQKHAEIRYNLLRNVEEVEKVL